MITECKNLNVYKVNLKVHRFYIFPIDTAAASILIRTTHNIRTQYYDYVFA